MGKRSAPRRLRANEARAVLDMVRISPQKLGLVAASIRGLGAAEAINQLSFSKRRIAGDVKKVVQSAVANAENNHDLDVDRLFVAEAWVGRTMVLKRFRARARGRVGKIEKPFSNITVVVRERAPEETA